MTKLELPPDLEDTLKSLLKEYGEAWAKFSASDNLWEWMSHQIPHTPWMRRQLARAWREGLIWRRPGKNQPAYIDENPYEDSPSRIRSFRAKTPPVLAYQWNGTIGAAEVAIEWIQECGGTARYHAAEGEEVCIYITREGGRTVIAYPFDYIIRTDEGFLPLSDKQFKDRFEPN